MSTLGTMMLRAGLLSEGQVADAAEHARVKRLSHVDAVLELGLADEDTLVAFLASKLLIPRVRQAVLERVEQATADRLPGDLAWQLLAVPVSVDELGNLTVAMADPTDELAVEAIARRTNSYLVRAVASVSNLRRTLVRLYGDEEQAYERAAAQRAAEERNRAREHLTAAELTLRQTDVSMVAVEAPSRPVTLPVPPAQPPTIVSPFASTPLGVTDSDVDDAPYSQVPSDDEYDAEAVEHVQGDPEESITTQIDTQSPARSPIARPQPPALDTLPIVEDDEPPLRITEIQTDAPPSARPQPAQREPTPADLVEGPARGPRRAANRPRAHTPWNPPLQGFNNQPVPLSPEAVAEALPKLESASDRDEITAVLLDFLGAGFNRVILFVHSHNELRGHDARGEDLLVEAVRQVRIPSTGKSVFAEVLERSKPFFGPMRETSKIDQAFSSALGGLKGNVLVLPILVGAKIPLLVFAHGSNHPVDPQSIGELSTAVSGAIQRLITSMRRGG
ncbi:hypothetical protein ACNOYE_37590 [Nannocystaceae bacterium ST9]